MKIIAMKKLLSIAFMLIAILAMNCSSPQGESSAVVKADKQLALKVEGMVCAVGCAKYIEKQVAKMDGISDCEVNFEDGTANISYSSDDTGEEEILEAITSLNDGQYSVTVVGLNNVNTKPVDAPKSSAKEDKAAEVSFHFPELVTYFISRIIR